MGNPQDPSAPPSPYTPPPGAGPDWNAPAPPINTPGLAIPDGQPLPVAAGDGAQMGPPTDLAIDGIPKVAAKPEPEVGVPMGLAPSIRISERESVPAEGSAPVQGTLAIPGQGAVAEARARGIHDAAENKAIGEEYRTAVDKQKQAQTAVSEVERFRASDIAENTQHLQGEIAKIDARGKQSQLAHDQTIQQRDQQLQDAVNAQKNMVFDPDKYVNSLNVGQKLFTAIAVGLSGIAASGSIGGNGQNLALNMLKDSIQHGVDQQKEAFRRAGVNVDMATNAYARARQAGMDDRDATTAARLASINEHKLAAETITARYEPQAVDARRQALLANLDIEAAKEHKSFAQVSQAAAARAASDVLNAQQTGFNMAVGAERLRLEKQNQQWQHDDRNAALAERAFAAQQKAEGRGGGVPPGWLGDAPVTNEQKNKAAELSGNERILTRKLNEMATFAENFGNEKFDRSELAKVASTAAQVKVALKDKFNLGVMSADDSKLLDDVARNPANITWTPATVAQLRHLMDQVHADTDDQMEGYGLQRDPQYHQRGLVPFKEAAGGK